MALFGRSKKKTPAPVVPSPEEPPALPEAPEPNSDGLRKVQDHIDYLLQLVDPLPPFGMHILDAWNQTLCEDLNALSAVPPVDLATIDGYAVRAADIKAARKSEPSQLRLIEVEGRTMPEGAAVRVVARAALPKGADAVLPENYGSLDGDWLQVSEPVGEGDYVTLAGSTMAIDTPLMKTGERLDARNIGLLAGAGIDKVYVRPRPRVVVLASGADITEPGTHMGGPDQTWDANSYLIAAAAKAAGAQVWRVGIVGNDPDELREAITDQLIRADLVISTTGSQRDYERVKAVVDEIGQTDFAEVAMLPGKTQAFALVGDDRVPMMLLPGNPVSAYVSFQVFVRPLLRKLMGVEPYTFTPVRAIVKSMLRSVTGQLQLMRGRLRHEHGIRNVEAIHDIDPLRELADCNALIVLDEETEVIRAGESAMCWLLDEE